MPDLAVLRVAVDSSDVAKSNQALDKLVVSGTKAEQSTNKLAATSKKLNENTAAGASAMQRWEQRVEAARQQQERLNATKEKTISLVGRLTQAFAALLGVVAVGQIIRMAEEFNQLRARLENIIPAGQRVEGVLNAIVRVSNKTGISIQGVTQGFVRLAPAAQALGKSTQQLLDFEQTFFQMGSLAGSTSEEIKNAMIQLSQGLASGALRGDELRSVMEQMPTVARVIADAMGIPFSQFKKSAEEGKIKAQVVFDAILAKKDEVQAAFDRLPGSVDRSFTQLQNSVLLFVGALNDTLNITQTVSRLLRDLAGGIQFLAGHIQEVITVITAAAGLVVAFQWATITEGIRTVTAALVANTAAWWANYAAQTRVLSAGAANSAKAAASNLFKVGSGPGPMGVGGALGAIGGVIPTVKSGAGGFGSAAEAKGFSDIMKGLGEVVKNTAATIGNFFMNALKNVGVALATAARAAMAFFGALLTNPLTYVALAIIGVVAALFKMQQQIKDTTGVTVQFSDLIQSAWNLALDGVNKLIDRIPYLRNIINTVSDAFANMGATISTWFGNISKAMGLTGLFNDIQEGAVKIADERAMADAKVLATQQGITLEAYKQKALAANPKAKSELEALQKYNDMVKNQVSTVGGKPEKVVEDPSKDAKKAAEFIANIKAELAAERQLYAARQQSEASYARTQILIEAEKKVREAKLKISDAEKASLVDQIMLTEQLKRAEAALGVINEKKQMGADLQEQIQAQRVSQRNLDQVIGKQNIEKEVRQAILGLSQEQAQAVAAQIRQQGVLNYNLELQKKIEKDLIDQKRANATATELANQAGNGPAAFRRAQMEAEAQASALEKAGGFDGNFQQFFSLKMKELQANRLADLRQEEEALATSVEQYKRLVTAQQAGVEVHHQTERAIEIENALRSKGLDDQDKEYATMQKLLQAQQALKRGYEVDAMLKGQETQINNARRLVEAQKQGVVWDSESQKFRSKALEDMQFEIQLNEQLLQAKIDINSEEAKEYKDNAYALRALNKTLDDTAMRQQRMVDLAQQIGQSFEQAFESAVLGGQSLKETLAQLASQLAKILIQASFASLGGGGGSGGGMWANIFNLVGRAATAFSGFGGFGGGGGISGSVGDFGAGGGATMVAANGAIMSGGNVIPFARGGVVGGPTLFPMRNGAGLMGEAGAEAIMPLRRLSNGRLGVEGSGFGGGGSISSTVVNIHVEAGSSNGNRDDDEKLANKVAEKFQKQLEVMIDARADGRISKAKRPGGLLNTGTKM